MLLEIYDKIRDGYRYICGNYVTDKDQIILLGYSRGAFVVRCIADIISNIGILTKDGLVRNGAFEAIFHGWQRGDRAEYSRSTPGVSTHWLPDDEDDIPQEPSMLLGDMFDDLCQDSNLLRRHVTIEVCSAFETVAAVGWPDFIVDPSPPHDLKFMDSELGARLSNCYHALALHERRKGYLPIVWSAKKEQLAVQRLHQCWFTGYHGDVGGGRRLDELSFLPLFWMIARMQSHVEFDMDRLRRLLEDPSRWTFKPKSCNCVQPCGCQADLRNSHSSLSIWERLKFAYHNMKEITTSESVSGES